MFQSSITAWLHKTKVTKEPVALQEIPPSRSTDVNPPPNAQTETERSTLEEAGNLQEPLPPKLQTSKADPFKISHPLPSAVTLEPLTPKTLPSFRRLNSLLLPVPYPAKFYDEILTDPVISSLALVAVWHDGPLESDSQEREDVGRIPQTGKPSKKSSDRRSTSRVVAGIRCRLLASAPGPADNPNPDVGSGPCLYISTLSTLSPYRTHGLATRLLQAVTKTAIENYGISSVVAHVWEANAEGLQWYKKRGFEIVSTEKEYYRRLRPAGAWLIRRDVRVEDALGDVDWGLGGRKI